MSNRGTTYYVLQWHGHHRIHFWQTKNYLTKQKGTTQQESNLAIE